MGILDKNNNLVIVYETIIERKKILNDINRKFEEVENLYENE